MVPQTKRHLLLLPLILSLLQLLGKTPVFCRAWITPLAPTTATRSTFVQPRTAALLLTPTDDSDSLGKEKVDKVSSEAQNSSNTATKEREPKTSTEETIAGEKKDQEEDNDNDDDDDDEYEYIEYETLTEADYLGSEWAVGTCFDNNNGKIQETWVRLVTKEDKNIAIWGDSSEGTWSLDVASQFFSISKEYLWGKQIWAGVVDDYYFVQGTVRGWTYLTPASVLGQWQGKRLGVDPEEAGTPPWFEVEEDDQEEGTEKSGELSSNEEEESREIPSKAED